MKKLSRLIAIGIIGNWMLEAMDVEVSALPTATTSNTIQAKSAHLKVLLPQEIEALETVKTTVRNMVDFQRTQDPIAAFKLASFFSNIQLLISSTEDVLQCLNSTDNSIESIGVGASPAIKQQLDQLITYLDAAHVNCNSLKLLVPRFQEIVADIRNYNFPITD